MNDISMQDRYGTLAGPTVLVIKRLLPGPIERAWSYLMDSDLRSRWLASGEITPEVGTSFELTWRNDSLTDGPGSPRPEGFGAEHSLACRVLAIDPPRRLAFTWGTSAEVVFDLKEQGNQVLFTITHSGVSERAMLLMVSAGWHAHLDTLLAASTGSPRPDFWTEWTRLKAEYDRRLPT
ncbi:SRPBCC family protein [Rhizobium rhizoryzae]|uniref:SRPBCC family protein n=1 Tax=Rhizobium rhizoryzae TaxID=451876 RepID=UPI0028A7475F|nr:SRPBCC family protein [Rhizobium rhizoryzae]